ncbi:ABC transporter substrate binding protein [Oscillospiraceae bacterium PP1C4]
MNVKGLLNKKKIICILTTALLSMCVCISLQLPVHGHKLKKVLFISAYTESFLTVPEQIKGMHSVFDEHGVILDIEYMDTKRYDTQENRRLFFQLLKYKLANTEPYDAVIAGDDNALQFVIDYQQEMFFEIPIVFLGVNDSFRAHQAAKNQYITGIIEEQSIKENIETAYRLNPSAKKVVAIVDNTLTGIGDKEQFYEAATAFEKLHFEDLNASDYTLEELGQILSRIQKDTILMFISMNEDKTGSFVDIDEGVEFVCAHTNVPIYRVNAGGVGQGVLGGKMISYSESGTIAANLVMQVLQGTPIGSIPLMDKSPNYYYFDYEMIKKYNINESAIPAGAILINKQPSFFEQYRELVIGVLIAIGFLVAFSVILFIDNIKRRRIEKKLKITNDALLEAYEELMVSEEELRTQYDTIQEQIEEITVLNQKYKSAMGGIDGAVWEMNISTKRLSISGSLLKIVQKDTKEGNASEILKKLLAPRAAEQLIREYSRYMQGDIDEINMQIPIEIQNECTRWVLVRGRGVFDSNGEVKVIHGILLDNTKMKEQEEYISYLAEHDFLTGLPNRMEFMSRLKETIQGGIPGAVFLLDLDNFKMINDMRGHVYGDRVLIEISHRLSELADEHLFVSRLGGDEFLLLLSGTQQPEIVKEYADRIAATFLEVIVLDGQENYVEYSMGITCFPRDSLDIDQLIMNADTAMYKVKHDGKNNYLFYFDELNKELKDKTEIELILRKAIKEDGFFLEYQPQVEVISGKIIGFEALLRLKAQSISPAKFIPVAEESGLIVQIGRWVTREAIRQSAQWRDKGLKPKPIAINFSSKQLRDFTYFEFICETLAEYHVEPRLIEIEVTESVLLEKTDKIIEFLNQLKDLGIHIALDDFGTGFSSLNYLTFIPVEKIKLDKSMNDKFLAYENGKVIDSMISLAHSLNLSITAEGIDKKEQYERLKEGGCDCIQGYLFSKPLKVEDAEKIYDSIMTV